MNKLEKELAVIQIEITAVQDIINRDLKKVDMLTKELECVKSKVIQYETKLQHLQYDKSRLQQKISNYAIHNLWGGKN